MNKKTDNSWSVQIVPTEFDSYKWFAFPPDVKGEVEISFVFKTDSEAILDWQKFAKKNKIKEYKFVTTEQGNLYRKVRLGKSLSDLTPIEINSRVINKYSDYFFIGTYNKSSKKNKSD